MCRRFVSIFAATVALASTGGCAVIARSSQPPLPVEGVIGIGGANSAIALSGDGRFEAFASTSTNLIPADTNNHADIFLRDRTAGTTERVSVASNENQADADAMLPSVSDDGRYVAFLSSATNLVVPDNNASRDVFVRDRQLGTTTRVSVDSFGTEANANSLGVSISDDGRHVAFASNATNLVAGDTNGQMDAFVRDRQTNTTTRESLTVSGDQSTGPIDSQIALSGNGNVVAFASAATDLLGPGADTNNTFDVFVRDRVAATTSRASLGPAGVEANLSSFFPAISNTGRYVTFASAATNLVAGDTNGVDDIFVRDRQTATTDRASVATGAGQANGSSGRTSISDNGQFVAFASSATNLVAGDSNLVIDIFVRDRTAALTTRATVKTGGAQAGGGQSQQPVISDDGAVIGFVSSKSNLVTDDTNAADDAFAHVRMDVETERVSVASSQANGSSANPAVNGDGRYVAFESIASNLVPRDTNNASDVFVRDHLTGTVERVSVTTGGVQGDGPSLVPAISADGRFVVFQSGASNLVSGDTNNVSDIFWRDRQTGVTERVSLGDTENQGGSPHTNSDVSNDGRYIVFATSSALNADDSNLASDVYRRDRLTGATVLISRDTTSGPANGPSNSPAISSSGGAVVFTSFANDLVASDTNGVADVFRRDVGGASTVRVSVATLGIQANGPSGNPEMSSDALTIAFDSTATNLVSGDANGDSDVFVRRLTCSPSPCFPPTTRVSVATDQSEADNTSSTPTVSSDGRYVAFQSVATDLVAGDTNGASDVFVRDRTTLRTSRASTQLFLGQANGPSTTPALSGDGRTIAFLSIASDLIDDDTNLQRDIFLRAQPLPTVTNVSPGSHPDGGPGFPVTITGTNFLLGAQVRFSRDGITAVVNTVTDTTITATFTIAPGTAAGPVDVLVANVGTGPGVSFGAMGRCTGCLTVT